MLAAEEHPTPAAVATSTQGSLYAFDSTWTNQSGKKVTWKESGGTTRIVALGYATCKGICPRIIGDMQRIEKELTEAEKGKCRFTFVSVDPEHDKVAELKALRSVAGHFGFEIVHHALQGLDDIEGAVASSTRDGVDALYVSGEPLLYNNMARVLPPVMAAGRPTVGTYPDWARAGLLMSYSADLLDDFRRAGIYAAKILGGEKPGDLPIEQASKFTLVVNARTAKQLGIAMPPTLLADEVIE